MGFYNPLAGTSGSLGAAGLYISGDSSHRGKGVMHMEIPAAGNRQMLSPFASYLSFSCRRPPGIPLENQSALPSTMDGQPSRRAYP